MRCASCHVRRANHGISIHLIAKANLPTSALGNKKGGSLVALMAFRADFATTTSFFYVQWELRVYGCLEVGDGQKELQ